MVSATDSEEAGSRRSAAQERSRAQTRQRLLDSADTLFRARGYAATTVIAIAAGAEVSLQTLYLVWGSKRALFRAAADAAATASGQPPTPEDWHITVRGQITELAGANGTAQDHVAAIVEVFARLAQHASTYWHLYAQAAAAEPEIADEWRLVVARRRETCSVVAALIPRDGLRDELDTAMVADTIWAVASPEVYVMLSREGGYDQTRISRWLTATLTNALCEPNGTAASMHPPVATLSDQERPVQSR